MGKHQIPLPQAEEQCNCWNHLAAGLKLHSVVEEEWPVRRLWHGPVKGHNELLEAVTRQVTRYGADSEGRTGIFNGLRWAMKKKIKESSKMCGLNN